MADRCEPQARDLLAMLKILARWNIVYEFGGNCNKQIDCSVFATPGVDRLLSPMHEIWACTMHDTLLPCLLTH